MRTTCERVEFIQERIGDWMSERAGIEAGELKGDQSRINGVIGRKSRDLYRLGVLLFIGLIWIVMASGCKKSGIETEDAGRVALKKVQGRTFLADTLYTPDQSPSLEKAALDSLGEAMKLYRLDPENASYFHRLGRAATATGDFQEALQLYMEGAFKFPEDPRVFLGRARIWMQLREPEKALQDLQTAEDRLQGATALMDYYAEKDPEGWVLHEVLYLQGVSNLLLGKGGQAASYFQKVRDLSVRDASVRGASVRGASVRGASVRGASVRDASVSSKGLQDVAHLLQIFSYVQQRDFKMAQQMAVYPSENEHEITRKDTSSINPLNALSCTTMNHTKEIACPVWMKYPEASDEFTNLYAAIRSLLKGEREPDTLWNQFYPQSKSSREIMHLGLALWHRQNGRESAAIGEFEKIVTPEQTPGNEIRLLPYGTLYLIAEAELSR